MPSEKMLPLYIEGKNIKDVNGNLIHLRGVNKPSFEWNKKGERMEEDQWAYAHNWGINVVRLPFKMEWMIEDENYRQRIDDAIALAEKYGMYIILDCHEYGFPDIPAWIDMWTMLAKRYLGRPSVLFDIFSEPHGISDEEWISLAQTCVNAIRDVNPDVLIVISANGWGNAPIHWVQTAPITGGNIIYSLHWYIASTPISKPYTLEKVKSWLINKGWKAILDNNIAPVIVGEFGASYPRDPDELIWLEHFLTVMHEWGMHWTYWSWWETPKEGTGGMCGCVTPAWDGTPNMTGEVLIKFLKK
ncbi:MAG: glycoside hydrolase family 5 protein [Nitrososphaeria archaeon]